MLYEGIDREIPNLDHVKKIINLSDEPGKHKTRIFYADGSYEDLRVKAANVVSASYPVIKADPGFQVIEISFMDGEQPETCDIAKLMFRSPVIAWRLVPDWYPTPITPGHAGDPELGDSRSGASAVLWPDGQVSGPDSWWPNLDAWITHVRKEWSEYRRRAAAA